MPAFDFLLPHLCPDWAGIRLIENQHVKKVTCSEAIWKKLFPVLDDSNGEIVSESDIEPSRFVGHDVAPKALHGRGSLSTFSAHAIQQRSSSLTPLRLPPRLGSGGFGIDVSLYWRFARTFDF
jgi:hypothetical protein